MQQESYNIHIFIFTELSTWLYLFNISLWKVQLNHKYLLKSL